jgi:citrate lyase subunit beta/citryl-CoA lyase
VGTLSRSFLFIPGNTPSMLQNLDVFESDSVIIDLEDSVLLTEKDSARQLVFEFLSTYTFTKPNIYIRVNDYYTEHFKKDIALLDTLPIEGYVLPKADKTMIHDINNHTTKNIIPIIESPMAVLEMEDIIKNNQVIGLLLGGEDLTKELSIKRTNQAIELLYIRQKMIITCSAYQKLSIDTPWTDKDNLEDLKTEIEFIKSLGFTSKSSIHPNHVDFINELMIPSKEEIMYAKRVVLKSEQEQNGAFSLDGKMVDVPVIERAKKILEKAKKYQIL